MRNRSLRMAAVSAAVAISTTSFVAAQASDIDPLAPTIVYGTPPVVIAVPPTGYLLDPSDARKPIYVVNQGPVYSGPNIYAVPTYSEGGYAYADSYPYYPPYYPYVRSYGFGPWHYFRADRPYGYRHYRNGYRPYGYLPYGAYRHQPAPSARIIQVPPRSEWTSLSR